MTIYDIISRFRRHPLALEEVAMTANMGLPWFYLRHRYGKYELRVRFLLHEEEQHDDRWFVSAAHQQVDLDCENGRVLCFRQIPGRQLLYITDIRHQIKLTAEPLQKLYRLCDQLLQQYTLYLDESTNRSWDLQEEREERLETLVEQYQELFRETVTEIGQEALYGIMYDAEA